MQCSGGAELIAVVGPCRPSGDRRAVRPEIVGTKSYWRLTSVGHPDIQFFNGKAQDPRRAVDQHAGWPKAFSYPIGCQRLNR
jgi:hypothetical protein